MTSTLQRPTIRCQFWSEKEPAQCVYWDNSNTICTYSKETVIDGTSIILRASLYPLCNYIGTAQDNCYNYKRADKTNEETQEKYDSAKFPRCILPDPYRYISKEPGCLERWVEPQRLTQDTNGNYILESPLDYSDINGYNYGKCNYSEGNDTTGGTLPTCSGYSPQHLGFGQRPIRSDCTTISGLDEDSMVPFNYSMLNYRSDLARCKWWDGDTYFTITAGEGKLKVEAPEFICTRNKAESDEFSEFKTVDLYKYQRPPCNGSAIDCKWYTGNLIASKGNYNYLANVYLRTGDKVLSDQILELRYNTRKEKWTQLDYDGAFINPEIYSWKGTRPELVYSTEGTIEDYTIESIRTYISDFECFEITHEEVPLTKGNSSDNSRPDFPTLIRKLKNLPLRPIIRSVFDTYLATNTNTQNNTTVTWENSDNIIEVSYSDHEYILIVGDTFYRDNVVFAINLSDPEFVFDFSEIDYYESIHSIGSSLNASESNSNTFDSFYKKLDCYLDFIQKAYPNKVYQSEFNGDNNGAFYIGVKTFFGENKIVVFDNGSGSWEYDKIVVTKDFCNGVLAQTSFGVTSTDTKISDVVDYERYGFQGAFKPTLDYEFKSFILSEGSASTLPAYTYFDTVMQKPSTGFTDGALLLGYYTYKIEIFSTLILDQCNIKFLGNHGYVLLSIDDAATASDAFGEKLLHRLIKPWEIEEDITLVGTDIDGNAITILMDIHEYCTDRMEDNQMILKPKTPSEYRKVHNPNIVLGKVYIFERHSFDYTPQYGTNYTIEDEGSTTVLRHTSSLSDGTPSKEIMTSGKYKLDSFPDGPLIASIVFRGKKSGRIKGQVKSDLIVWVKKPFCSDVEIRYSWTANYMQHDLLPSHYCFVEDIDQRYGGTSTRSYSPSCGDHYFGTFSTRPSWMWYPYCACDSYASYDIFFGSGEYDPAPMEFWLNDVGNPIIESSEHGTHDLRMLGPSDSYGFVTDVHASIWACSCDFSYANQERTGDIFFNGSARVRTAISAEDMWYVLRNDGTGPKFGNKHRDYLMSFRSNASIYYLTVADSGKVAVDKKWVPAYETFYTLNYTKEYKNYPFKLYFNTDDALAVYYNQLGALKVSDSIDNVTVKEALVVSNEGNSEDLARFSFKDVFRKHYTTTYMSYPQSRVQYSIGTQTSKQITAWYTYYDPPNTSTDAIHGAWREDWSLLERPNLSMLNSTIGSDVDICELLLNYSTLGLSFLDIEYPNYTFDYMLVEHRRVCLEGSHVILWYASQYIESDPFMDNFFLISLDGGPYRLLDKDLNLYTDVSYIEGIFYQLFSCISNEELVRNMKFYDFCSGSKWLNSKDSSMDLEDNPSEVIPIDKTNTFMLYDSSTIVTDTELEAELQAEENEREVLTTDGFYEVKNYYNSGLIISTLSTRLSSLPYSSNQLTYEYEYKLERASDDDSDFSTTDSSQFYPANISFGMEYYDSSGTTLEITFKFIERPIVIEKIKINYIVGHRIDVKDEGGSSVTTERLFNEPEVVFSNSVGGTIYTKIEEIPFKFTDFKETPSIEFREVEYILNANTLTYMNEKVDFFKLKFNYVPSFTTINTEYEATKKELNNIPTELTTVLSNFYFNTVKGMHIASIILYEAEFTDSSETIETHERKFHISTGGYGDIPIHGKNNTGSLLYPLTNEPTVYQYDTSVGMSGWPGSTEEFKSISKQRGRLVGPIKQDKLEIPGDYLEYEAEQSKIYNAVLEQDSETINMTSMLHEILEKNLEHTGVKYVPQWNCVLTNKALVPLGDVISRDKYNPPGHQWMYKDDPDALQPFYNCGGGGKRKWKILFAYAWGRTSGIYNYVFATDVFDLYSYGLTKTFSRWLNGNDVIYRDRGGYPKDSCTK